MAAVIDACEQSLAHPGWAAFRDLPYDEVSAMREWLCKVFEHGPPQVRLAGLWFGLFHPSVGGGGATTDIRVGGSTRFTDNGELDWAYGLEYRPVQSWARRPVLDIIHSIAYGGRRLVGEEGNRLRNAAVWSLGLGYGAFAIQRLLIEIGPDVVLRGNSSAGVAVGFDSGDFLLLGRLTPGGWVRIASGGPAESPAAADGGLWNKLTS
jgi:hypothetical protein